MQILVVEDEYRLAKNIQKGLTMDNFTVDIASNGTQALSLLVNGYDLIILDLMIPEISGEEVLKKIRENSPHLPVLILSAKVQTEDKVRCLDAGADDYLSKPFSFEELTSRIHALIRRSTKTKTILSLDSLSLNPYSKQVFRNKKEIKISSTEYRLLEYLMRHENQVLSETNLLEHVWDHSYDGLSNIVSVYIGYLRKKIDKDFPEEKPLFQTIRGLGYKISDA